MCRRLILWGFLCCACACASEEPTNYTIGSGTTSGTGTPIGGRQSVYPNCTGDLFCYQNERCDLTQGVCVPADDSTSGQSNGSTPRGDGTPPGELGVSMPLDAGTTTHQTGSCTTPNDIALFQAELICAEDCNAAYALAETRCQMTPARIADCLATASDDQNECLGMCTPIAARVSACLARCSDLSNIGFCGLECLRSTFSFSNDCESCFGGLFECGGNFCQSLCLGEEAVQCGACLGNICGRDFASCAGMMLPR